MEVPSNPAGKRGFIFDEAHERSSTVRFNNIAGEEHANCKGNLEVRVIRTVEEMFDAKTSTKLDSTSSQVGQELNINAKLGADGSLSSDITNSLEKLFIKLFAFFNKKKSQQTFFHFGIIIVHIITLMAWENAKILVGKS